NTKSDKLKSTPHPRRSLTRRQRSPALSSSPDPLPQALQESGQTKYSRHSTGNLNCPAHFGTKSESPIQTKPAPKRPPKRKVPTTPSDRATKSVRLKRREMSAGSEDELAL